MYIKKNNVDINQYLLRWENILSTLSENAVYTVLLVVGAYIIERHIL